MEWRSLPRFFFPALQQILRGRGDVDVRSIWSGSVVSMCFMGGCPRVAWVG